MNHSVFSIPAFPVVSYSTSHYKSIGMLHSTSEVIDRRKNTITNKRVLKCVGPSHSATGLFSKAIVHYTPHGTSDREVCHTENTGRRIVRKVSEWARGC